MDSNVESAYTKVRFGKGGADNWSFTTANGDRVAYGRDAVKHTPPAPPADKPAAP